MSLPACCTCIRVFISIQRVIAEMKTKANLLNLFVRICTDHEDVYDDFGMIPHRQCNDTLKMYFQIAKNWRTTASEFLSVLTEIFTNYFMVDFNCTSFAFCAENVRINE